MKKMNATLTLHDGTTKQIYVYVDEETAAMLERLEDKELVNQYLIGKFKVTMSDYSYHRHTVSFEKAKEKGFEIASSTDLLDSAIQEETKEEIRNAIKRLDPQQQWLVNEIYFKGRKQVDVANVLGVDHTAIRNRLRKIMAKLKKFLN